VKTRFCKADVVDVVPYVDATMEQKKAFVNLVQCYSLADEGVMCMFHLDNLDAYMNGHMYGSYLSFYKPKRYALGDGSLYAPEGGIYNGNDILYTRVDGEVLKEENPRGCVASRSGELVVRGHKEVVYWMDSLVVATGVATGVSTGVSTNERVKGASAVAKIQRELFETHVYKVGLIQWKELVEGAIGVWLFRRIGSLLSGVVPLVRFYRREYDIPNNPGFFKGVYPEHVVLVEISSANLRKMTDGLERCRGHFEIWGMMDEGCLVGLIRAGVIKVYILERKGDVLAMYFFRDMRMVVEGPERSGGAVLELAGSIYLEGGVGLFRRGFLGSLGEIVKKSPVYRRLCVDDISENGVLDFGEWYCLGQIQGAYYTWNLVATSGSSVTNSFMLF